MLDKETLDFRKRQIEVLDCSAEDCGYDQMSDREKKKFLDIAIFMYVMQLNKGLKLTQEERDCLWDMLEKPEWTKDSESLHRCFKKVREKWCN